MNITRFLLAGSLLVAAAACSDSKSSSTTTAPAVTAAPDSSSADTTAPATGGEATIKLADSSLGKILTNGSGMTLYLFTPDTATTSACTGGCASAWPAFTEAAVAGDGIDASQFGTLTRDDGTTQVTYFGHPLYLYAGDTEPGTTNGQGSGGSWFAVTAAGGQAGK